MQLEICSNSTLLRVAFLSHCSSISLCCIMQMMLLKRLVANVTITNSIAKKLGVDHVCNLLRNKGMHFSHYLYWGFD